MNLPARPSSWFAGQVDDRLRLAGSPDMATICASTSELVLIVPTTLPCWLKNVWLVTIIPVEQLNC